MYRYTRAFFVVARLLRLVGCTFPDVFVRIENLV